MRRKRWRKRSQLHCSLPQQCSRVVLIAKVIVFCFPVNKAEEGEKCGGRGGGGRDHNYNTVFSINPVELYSWGEGNYFFPVHEEEENMQ